MSKNEGEFERQFGVLVNLMSPKLPEQLGGTKLTSKINNTLSPTLLKSWLPPMPKKLKEVLDNVAAMKLGANKFFT